MQLLYCYSMNSEMHARALEGLKKLLEKDDGNIEAHILMVSILLKQNSLEKAINVCQHYAKKYTLQYRNHHLLGVLYKEQGKTDAAYRSFINALRINPMAVESLS